MNAASHYKLAIVGAGAAGMAAAVAAAEKGLSDIIILDRNRNPGGILRQCIHDGFGMYLLGESKTGPEYAEYWGNKIISNNIKTSMETEVLDIDYSRKPYKLTFLNRKEGQGVLTADSIILATGCYEKTLGQMRIPGSRPAGIYTAGSSQYMVNIQNLKPGKSVVILGSGDIGLIMARRLTLEGIKIKMILGVKASGLARNYIQCVQDFNLPIRFEYTVLSTHGYGRLKGVTIAPVDDKGQSILDKKEYIPCDTLLIAAGLIPEDKLWIASGGISVDIAGRTSIPGIFACGNVTRIYDLADKVSLAGKAAGIAACEYLINNTGTSQDLSFLQGDSLFNKNEPAYEAIASLKDNEMLCTMCPKGCKLLIEMSGEKVNVTGNGCTNGAIAAAQEKTLPKRIFTTTVKVSGSKEILVPVRSERPMPRNLFLKVVKECSKITCKTPVSCGQVIIENVLDSGVNIIASGSVG